MTRQSLLPSAQSSGEPELNRSLKYQWCAKCYHRSVTGLGRRVLGRTRDRRQAWEVPVAGLSSQRGEAPEVRAPEPHFLTATLGLLGLLSLFAQL